MSRSVGDTPLSWSNTQRGPDDTTTAGSRPPASRRRAPTRSGTTRPRTAFSTVTSLDNQRTICAVSESRGVSPTVGVAFVNLDTWEAVLSQICDSQTYARTVHKLTVYRPSEILFPASVANANSKLSTIVQDNLDKYNLSILALNRSYYSESEGLEYVQQLAHPFDVDAIKVSITGKYFAICAFAAALKYIEVGMKTSFPFHSLRIKYEPPEGSMMIDVSTLHSLELIQNVHDPKSKHCLFGHLNHTLSPMGARLLKSNILQPLTNPETLNLRLDAVEEMSGKEDLFFAVRQALKEIVVDVDRILTAMLVIIQDPNLVTIENSINNVISLRQFVLCVGPLYNALDGATSTLLTEIRRFCGPAYINPVRNLIETVVNEDVKYSKSPLDLRNQRTFAVRAGVNGLLDVSRQAYKENSDDALEYVAELHERHGLKFDLKFDSARQYFLRLPKSELEDRNLPPEFINVVKSKGKIECSTMGLLKLNQKVVESHNECMAMSDEAVETLVDSIRAHAGSLFKISESVAMLDMISAFAQLVTLGQHVRPILRNEFALQAARHPIKEKIQKTRFIPNDIAATDHSRMQIITGCNMSGKSTYIRMIALISIMSQIGCFVPASYAALPIRLQVFARVSVDDSIEGNISTFATEMQEMAFILRNVDARSLVIVDELGRGTSTRDGLAIAMAISEALIDSKSFVWFVTHFTDLARIMPARPGVLTLHLAVETPNADTTRMTYALTHGPTPSANYGLALARMVPLPASIIPRATQVSRILDARKAARTSRSAGMVLVRRRRLLLELKRDMERAWRGRMQGGELKTLLEDRRERFVADMARADEAAGGDGGHDDRGSTLAPSTVGEGGEPSGASVEDAIVIDDELADLLTEDWSSSEG